jgi:hypothetical protein
MKKVGNIALADWLDFLKEEEKSNKTELLFDEIRSLEKEEVVSYKT